MIRVLAGHRNPRARGAHHVGLLVAALALAACGGPDSTGSAGPAISTEPPGALQSADSAAPTGAPSPAPSSARGESEHGGVEGAQELDRAPASLAILTDAGELSLVDLAGLSSTPLPSVPGATGASTDGRLMALEGADGAARLVDTGVWTQDHGDHQHYYRTTARDLGDLPAQPSPGSQAGPPRLASSTALTAVASGERLTILERESLEAGEPATGATATIDPGSSAIPVGSHVLAVRGGRAALLDRAGSAVGQELACTQPAGGASTRAGAVVGCRGGAVLAAQPEGREAAPSLEWVALPEDAPEDTRLISLSGRSRRPGLAALDSHGGWWLLDARRRTWSGPAPDQPGAPTSALVAVSAMDDTHHRVVGVDTEGRVHVWADGAHEASTEPIASPDLVARTGIHPTADRAYLPAASGDAVLEVNPASQAAVERTVPAPGLLALALVGT